MATLPEWLTIGDLAARSGVAASALRYYESLGLIDSQRTSGNQRRYHRAMLRRVSVIRAAQGLGLSLERVGSALDALGDRPTPSARDWDRMAAEWREDLDARIAAMEKLRDDLSGCIGCGCLSLERCRLLNRDDRAASKGSGPRYLMGDTAGAAE